MSAPTDLSFDLAVTNLLTHCAALRAGDRLLIVAESAEFGYYDGITAQRVADAARARGIEVASVMVPFQEMVRGINDAEVAMMEAATCTIFFARLGDQMRFRALPRGVRAVVCYALDMAAFCSTYGTAHYAAFVALKRAVDAMVSGAREVRVTCPLGTDFRGNGSAVAHSSAPCDVTVARFPMSVFAPVPAVGFSGRAALAGFLMGTGSRYYAPYGCALQAPLLAVFEGGRLQRFEGRPDDVARATAHVLDVAARFDLDAGAVHSWHAGIHPGCAHPQPVEEDYLRWGGAAFGNPRILHFHTCGVEAPGEISWNIIDPTIWIDGVAVWENGQLQPDRVPGGAAILARYPCAAACFAAPARDIGVDMARFLPAYA
ncbi:hypothetical protein SAMN05216227_1008115 [Pseudorhodobacter antarcticus]|jgi:hypothetical protein|uniref:Leucyl aminopeptidase (Aminopeptidase T) n=1 Tax=Pseudorhodobacter antarcticus TaxID=1077947 RepID=A0A1H8EC00_9RHOB|nr:hypothetical protein [Pseudorhodobacter antarcticus]SEN16367.1 hypothetical protein SAMN05216227_1008115 [Pseudorhodobacter antarcticus]